MAENWPLPPQKVALLGFGDFERHALASYMRLSKQRLPEYRQVDTLAEADFVIADADHLIVLDAVRAARRVGDAVFIGHTAPDGALGWTMRPIDPLQVFRELDAAVALRHADVLQPLVDSGSGGFDSRPAALDSGSGGLDSGAGALDGGERTGQRAGDSAPTLVALVVDVSESSLRHLRRQLHALGMRTESATTSQLALGELERQRFDLVILEVDLGPSSELDGLMLCQRLKKQGGELPPPRVVIVSARHSPTDRVRGTFAGCDAYLGKPLDDAELVRTLRQLGLISGADVQRRQRRRDTVPTSGPVPLSGPR
ncbi:MAG TPA: response regulator [Burkholderiaceae bacterium]|nr:response regulator [Burkholderiaceae bacterium]